MRFAPFQVLVVYLVFTFLLAIFGPVRYRDFNETLTGGFMLLVMIAIAFGYFFGVKKTERNLRSLQEHSGGLDQSRALFISCLIIGLFALALAVLQAMFAGQLNLSAADLGQTYVDAYQDYERNTGSYSVTFIIYTLAGPPTFIASVWGLLYFKAQRPLVKAAIVLLVVGSPLFYTIGTGKQKQLSDLVIYAISVAAIVYGRGGRAIRPGFMIATSAALLLGLLAFIAILSQRYAALAINAFTINAKSNPLQFVDLDHPVFKWFGLDFGFSMAMLSSYLSQGYFGLNLALQTPFEWTWLLGSSYSVGVIANRLFGLPWMYMETYNYRVGEATGWGASKWHTIFPEWASDFTFGGTVLLFAIFASIFASCWVRSIRTENPYAVLLFALLVEGALFIPANNQLFISPGGVVTVLVVGLLYWRSVHKSYPAIGGPRDVALTATS